ncbi:U-box domain-containing protein 4 [Prunus yedoensis var. nudiflora]|uniref:U-box domain-containing protein 4 n=1 Tax=Prunus yedoensis var. nudiflora TaxID=2094558 RepID=A0A314ZFT9_PRUYE|nr:U-box domain-containing protein 4 [Prunus yedoensis var. nudiflora]
MVSLQDSHSSSNHFPPHTRNFYSPSSTKIHRQTGRSMRTIRSNIYHDDQSRNSFTTERSSFVSENLTDSVIDMRLGELALRTHSSAAKSASSDEEFLQLSQAFSDFSACSSDISGELQRLATLPSPENEPTSEAEPEVPEEPCQGFLQRENFSTEIIESISPEDLLPTVKICVDGLQSPDPWTQEHAVTALLNLSLHESNKAIITNAGAIKSLVYVLKTGTETSKQNAACALLSLALIEENKSSIGACGAIPPLVSLLISGSTRGKKDALTTLYKLCSIKPNKERAVNAGAVKPLVALVAEQGTGLAEKAMVVLSSLAGVEEGKEAIVEEGGLAALVEAIEDGSVKGKEFAVLTLLQLCTESVRNRGLLVREGGIPPLVALSQTGTLRAKHKAETLLGYLREPRQEASSSAL